MGQRSFASYASVRATLATVASPRADEVLVLIFLALLTIAGWIQAGSPGLEPLHNSRLTLLTVLIVVACLPLLINAANSGRSPIAFVRAWLPLILGLLCYENLKHLHANAITLALGIEPLDPLMLQLDEWLFGAALPLLLEPIVHPALTSYLQMAYTWFYYLMPVIVLVTFYVRASLESFLALRKALIYCLLGGYICYLLMPVAGPLFLIGDHFTVPLRTNGIVATLVFDTLRYNWDCFPSLHTAVPVLLCLLVRRFVSLPVRLVLFAATGSIVFSTIYLRLHYGVDIVAGVAWAWLIHVCFGHRVSGWSAAPGIRPKMAARQSVDDRFIAPAKLCFVITGACALALEQVFEKVLSTIIGSTSESAALVLAVYFSGLALGAGAYRFIAPTVRRPLLFYGVMESLVGLWALVAAIGFVDLQHGSAALYVAMHSVFGPVAAKVFCAASWILLPTLVMGLSFPAMAHFLKQRCGDTRSCQAAINAFYGINLLGGALAAFAAPYLVFPVTGLDGALIACAVLEGLVLYITWTRSNRLDNTAQPRVAAVSATAPLPRDAWNLAAFAFLSGFVFFGLEVLWVHLAGTVVGTSVYAFANTLLAVLLGLFLGNRLVFRIAQADREIDVAVYRQLIGGSVFILVLTFALWDDIPRIFLMVGPYTAGFWSGEFVRLMLLFVLVAIPTMFIGTLFPGLFRTAAFRRAGPARMVSFVSVANALGCIAGAALCGLYLLPNFGSENAFKLLISAMAAALVVFGWRTLVTHRRPGLLSRALAIGTVALLVLVDWNYREITAGYNVYFDVRSVGADTDIVYLHESPAGGFTSVVDNTITAADGSIRPYRTLLTNGKFQGNDAWEVDAQIGVALIPVLHTRRQERALVIGLGTGQTANIVAQMGFGQIDIAEISPGIIEASKRYFAHINDDVLDLPQVTVHRDDGRHVLLLSDARYDLITTEISSMWFNGATNLYSADFFKLAAQRLAQGGVLQQWLQVHHVSPREIGAVLAAARSAFRYVEFWLVGGQGIIVASADPLRMLPQRIQQAASTPVIRQLGEQFLTRVTRSRYLDAAAIDRLIREAGQRGVVANDDTNRLIEFRSPRYNLSRADHPRLNRRFFDRYREADAVRDQRPVNSRTTP